MSRAQRIRLGGALVLWMLPGCRGDVVATVEMHGAGFAETQFHSTGAPLELWADTNGRWAASDKHSHLPAHYEIDVISNGATLGHVSCETISARKEVCGSHVYANGSAHGDCEVRLGCELPTIPAGEAVLQVYGAPMRGASEVTKMSINVRKK